MLKITRSIHLRILCSIAIVLLSFFVLGTFFYIQTKSWIVTQQKERLDIALRQVNTLTGNMGKAALSASRLASQPCSPMVLHELRRLLALAPNVANIELSENDIIYCSSLTGNEHQVMKDHHPIYLTNEIEELPGHPYLVLRHGQGSKAIFASADGYYLRNILDSASMQLPVIFVTSGGWMDSNGVIHSDPIPAGFSLKGASTVGTYYFASLFNEASVVKFIIHNGKFIIIGILLMSLFFGVVFFIWSGQSIAPKQILGEAIKNKKIIPYIQPIVRSSDYYPVGGEVLARWVDQESVIPPAQFIALAEQSDLIIPLTRSLIMQVHEKLVTDIHNNIPFLLSFNVSAPHFESAYLASDFSLIMNGKDNNIKVVLEITEREALTYNDKVGTNILHLKEMGIDLALDDFGTGYSSLEYFQHINVDYIKIDKQFVQRLGEDPLSNHIIDNVVDLASRLGIKVIAEGVETESQAIYLQESGVDFLQGYLFSKPVPVAEFNNYIRNFV